MNAIVLMIDGLQPAYLGCYGNSWVGTPEIDRLAAESFLLDQALIDSPDWRQLYRAYWEGTHAWRQRESDPTGATLAEQLRAAGTSTTLLTDDADIATQSLAGDFDDIVLVPTPDVDATVGEIEDTQFARLMAAATDWLTRAHSPFLLWIHARGLTGPWDAPLALRYQYVEEAEDDDEKDAPPPDDVAFAARHLPLGFDPDELLGIRRAYAGQVAAIDTCVGALLDALDESGQADDTLFTMLSLRGYPLGEHARVGFIDNSLDEELVHLAWLTRLPGQIEPAGRTQCLVQPPDLYYTLLEHFQVEAPSAAPWGASILPLAREERIEWRDRALLSNTDGQRAIRTPAWYLKATPADRAEHDFPVSGPATLELFRKPDDRWEVNQVADRCGEVASSLECVLTACASDARKATGSVVWQPLEAVLLEGID